MPSRLVSLAALVAFVLTFAVTTRVSAQPEQTPRPSSVAATGTSSAPSELGASPWGTRMEHWLTAGLALSIGAITVAVGTGIDRYAVDLNAHARDPLTTQTDAYNSSRTANDFLLAAEVLWSVGAALAGIGLTWVIVLCFSTPAPSAAPDAASAPSVSLRATPLGISLEGVF
ncbi:MAG: hypothetical protein U0234_09580 [Sandaracinus sp.]